MNKPIPPHREAPLPDKCGMHCSLCGFYSVPHRMHQWDVEWIDLARKSGTDTATVLICNNCHGERQEMRYRHDHPEETGETSAPLTRDDIDQIVVANAALSRLQRDCVHVDRSTPSFFQLIAKPRKPK